MTHVQLALGDAEATGSPVPTAEQRGAIDARDRDVFCEAGAGTGKTRVIVERYCDAIDAEESKPDEILAFTFTERAAAELRSRVRRELGARARTARERGDEERSIRLGRLARETERAWVMTIHGFCRRLLGAHPAAAGIDPRFRVLDETEAARLRRRACEAAVADVLRDGRDHVEVIAAYEQWRVIEMTLVAHERLRSQGMTNPELPAVAEPVRSLRASDEGPAEPLSPAEREAALRARATFDALLAAFHRRYEALKADRAGLDFADLELRALELLRRSDAVAHAWRGRFAHVMVDEFQDTNRVQLELVEALRGPDTRVFRVGDELQSIYRFRNADLAVFRAERQRALADPDTVVQPLTGNFRSAPGVLAAVNTLGAALIGEGFRPLAHPGADGEGAAVAELLLVRDEGKSLGWQEHGEALGGPPSVTQAKIVAEARVLAERLRELVDEGVARAGEIVVLLRAFTHVDAYEHALDRAGLDPYVVGGRGYWSQQQVEDMLRLLAVVANPLDDEMLLGALANPACGVSPDALWLLRRATRVERTDAEPDGPTEPAETWREERGPGHLWPLVAWRFGDAGRRPDVVDERWLEAIDDGDRMLLERFCATLTELRAAAALLPVDELVERTMTAFGYDLAMLARPGGRGRMANVRKLIRLAHEFETHEGRDLRGFLDAAEELTSRDEREGLAATQAEDHDGVRVMTVHAAKGLEFPVVAVPDLGRGLSQGERGGDLVIGRLDPAGAPLPEAPFGLRLVFPDADPIGTWRLHELQAGAVEEAAEEGARLVHVAATRAERRLILSGSFKEADCEPAEPRAVDTPLRRLLPALAGLGWSPAERGAELELEPAPAAAGCPAGGRARIAIRVEQPSAERAVALSRQRPRTSDGVQRPPATRPPLARPDRVVPVGHLSYSALAEYERCGYRFHIERLLGLEPPPSPLHPASGDGGGGEVLRPSGRESRLGLGNAVHAALEWCARHSWDRPSAELLQSLLAEQGLDSDAEAVGRVRRLVDGWLDSALLGEIAGANVRAEVPFAIELAETIVRGQIDVLAGSEEPIVVDYKTDALDDGGAAELGQRYRGQRELYALAAATGQRVERVRAVHCFLEAPDEPVEERFEADDLAAARSRLEDVIALIRDGAFEPTAVPTRQVCNGCPAAARLCPHPAWRPQR